MAALFDSLLRGNFRCGRMLGSRTREMAGRLSMPVFAPQ